MSRTTWVEASAASPCRVCGSDGWCTSLPDGSIVNCRRTSEGSWKQKDDTNGGRYYVHRFQQSLANSASTTAGRTDSTDEIGSPETLDKIYNALLKKLRLESGHRENLRNRGLSDSEIEERGYRSFPRQGRPKIASQIHEEFGDVVGNVPGFVRRENGESGWTIRGAHGIAIPVLDLKGRIVALKIRSDVVSGTGRYTYVSSKKNGGPGPGSPVHVPRHRGIDNVQTIRIVEGELAADVCTAKSGILSIGVGGVASWRSVIPVLDHLGTKQVLIAFDADYRTNSNVARMLRDAIHTLPKKGYQVNIETWDQTIAKGPDDLLASGGQPHHIDAEAILSEIENGPLVKAELGFQRTQVSSDQNRRRILVPGVHHTLEGGVIDVAEIEFAHEVLAALPAGVLFRRADEYVGIIAGSTGRKRFRLIQPVTLQNLASKFCNLWSVSVDTRNEQRGLTEKREAITAERMKLALDAGSRSDLVPPIDRIVTYPVAVGENFEVVLQPGFNAEARTYLDTEFATNTNDLDNEFMSLARKHLEDLVVDFPFADEASRQNFFALLLTPILRPAIAGNVPFFLVEAPLERTGKTKLCEGVLGGTILGYPTPAMQIGRRDEETEKRITALLLEGGTLVHLDNLGCRLDSPALASLLTAKTWSGRILGRSEIVRIPNDVTLVASGNNVQSSGEIAKRVVLIRLQPRDGRPEERRDFKHSDLDAFVRESRTRTLGILIGMIQRWKRAGRPKSTRAFGGFERWTNSVGGILELHGFNSWLTNRNGWVERAATNESDLNTFVVAWSNKFGFGRDMRPAELLPLISDLDSFATVLDRPESGRAAALGKKLRTLVDRPIGDHIIRTRRSGNGSVYVLERLERGGLEVGGGFGGGIEVSEIESSPLSGADFDPEDTF